MSAIDSKQFTLNVNYAYCSLITATNDARWQVGGKLGLDNRFLTLMMGKLAKGITFGANLGGSFPFHTDSRISFAE